MDRLETRLVVSLIGVAVVSLLFPPHVSAKKWTVEVGYEEVNDCPAKIVLDPPQTMEAKWHKFLGSTMVIWEESPNVAGHQAEWTINWVPKKNANTEFSHLPSVIAIPANKDKSDAQKAIAAYAPNSKNKWYWTYQISVKKPNCTEITMDPAIIFRDGGGGANLPQFLLFLFLLLALGGGGFYAGRKFADRS